MAKPIISADRLRELLTYDADTGLFTRLVQTCNRVKVGDVAGRTDSHGYRQISVLGRKILAHRLAWLYIHGTWPSDQIDHINGVRSDNRIANLRDTSNAINRQNERRARSNNQHGFMGVSTHGTRWKAKIGVDGNPRYIGSYDTPELAHAAYIEAKRLLHPGCTI